MNDQPSIGRERASTQERVYTVLREMLQSRRIRPGEVLLEVKVAEAFGISRSPARIALHALRRDGLIRDAAGRGYVAARRGQAVEEGLPAALDRLELKQTPQWSAMYGELEQELLNRMLFDSVRITEDRLAQHFGVSRTVVRDVLGRMHGVGLVIKDRLGHWIAEQVTPQRVAHLFELRVLLEPEALRQACPLIPHGRLEAARQRLHGIIADFPGTMAEIDAAETDLHIDMLSHCPNLELVLALKRTHLLFAPTRYLTDPLLKVPRESIELAFHEHAHIIELLQQRKIAKAGAALRAHLSEAHERWKRRFEVARVMQRPAMPAYLSEHHEGRGGA